MNNIGKVVFVFLAFLFSGCQSTDIDRGKFLVFFTSSDVNDCGDHCFAAEKDIISYGKRTSGITVQVIDIKKSPEKMNGYSVHAIPLVITFVDGRETGRFYGYINDVKELEHKLKDMLGL